MMRRTRVLQAGPPSGYRVGLMADRAKVARQQRQNTAFAACMAQIQATQIDLGFALRRYIGAADG